MRVAAGQSKRRPLPSGGFRVAAPDYRRLRQVVREVHGPTWQLLLHENLAVRKRGVWDDPEGAAVPVCRVHVEWRRHQSRRAGHHQFEDFQRLLPVWSLIERVSVKYFLCAEIITSMYLAMTLRRSPLIGWDVAEFRST